MDVYDFTHLLLESYCSLRNCIVPSVVGILAATVLELDQTLMPIISKHNNHFLMSVFTNRIDIEIYLECGISQCASAWLSVPVYAFDAGRLQSCNGASCFRNYRLLF